MAEPVVRVCANEYCHVIAYSSVAQPNHVNQACPSCGKIGDRQK